MKQQAINKLEEMLQSAIQELREEIRLGIDNLNQQDEQEIRLFTRDIWDKTVDIANKHSGITKAEAIFLYSNLQEELDDSYVDFISKHGFENSGKTISENIAYSIFNLLHINIQNNIPQLMHEELNK